MCDGASDFSDVKVGDKLWSVQLGECEVVRVDADKYPVACCDSENRWEFYSVDGRAITTDAAPSLFWSRPEIIAPPKPKRKVTKTVEAWAHVLDGKIVMMTTHHVAVAPLEADVVHLTGTYEVEE